MKKFVSIVLILILGTMTTLLSGCGGYKLRRVVSVPCAGSSAFVSSSDGAPYKIKELNIVSENNLFTFDDYVGDKNGTEYTVVNSRNDKIGVIKLSKKSEIYNPEIFEFNLDTYGFKTLIITEEMNYVNIYSSDPSVAKELFIMVQYRTEPLDITFNNVNIYTVNSMPVLFNPFDVDINIICKGTNTIQSGGILMSIEQYNEYLNLNKQQIENGFLLVLAPEIVWCYGMYQALDVYTNDSLSGFIQTFKTKLDEMLSFVETYWSYVENAVYGEKGADGFDGISTIQAFNVNFMGDGNLTLVGGNGGNGLDASLSLMGSRGGDGGDAGPAIYCKTSINVMNSANYKILSGSPGIGGKGSLGIGGADPDGKSGNLVKGVQAIYEFVR